MSHSKSVFPPMLLGKLVFIFIFFPPTKQQNPCRDPSTIGYSANALMAIQSFACFRSHLVMPILAVQTPTRENFDIPGSAEKIRVN